jgi:hypothetical protein
MTCLAIHEVLPLFVEGDLPRRKAAGVARHLVGCTRCRGLAEEYRQSQRWLREAPGPVPTGAALDRMRQSVWRQLDREPRPSSWWLAVERGWAALRRWASQPAVAGMAVMLIVVGSVTFTRVGGLGGARLGESLSVDRAGEPRRELPVDPWAEAAEDPENVLAQASPQELSDGMSDGVEPGEGEAAGETADNAMRIEIQTRDPNVRIIWFTPPADTPSVEN